MRYMSTTEAARLWGISTNRITILANQGRIPGAERVGARWMIPDDARKPADGRTRGARALGQGAFFRFPSYVDFEPEQFTPPLSEEEIALRKVQALYLECRFDEASSVLSDLPDKASNRYVGITALFYACLLCTQGIGMDRIQEHTNRLRFLLADDFPYKREMSFLLCELDASIGANQYFLEEFRVDPAYAYHPSAYPHIQSTAAFSLCIRNASAPHKADLSIYEVACAKLESEGHRYDAQRMHIFLCAIYLTKGDQAVAALHLRKSFEIAEARHYYYMPAMYYSYLGPLYESVLAEFPAEFADKIRRLGEDIHNRYVTFMGAMSVDHVYSALDRKDFQYVLLISRGSTNKEIASKLSVSESTVAKRMHQLCEKLHVGSKSELKELFIKYNNQKFFAP